MKTAIYLLTLFLISCGQVDVVASQNQCKNGFKVLEHMKYQDAPDFRPYGIEPIRPIVDQRYYWPNGDPENTSPDINAIAKYAAALPSSRKIKYYYHDIENIPRWSMINEVSELDQLRTLAKVVTIATETKRERPEMEYGFFSMQPGQEWQNMDSLPWRESNTRFMPLSYEVDWIGPSLYMLYDNMIDWVKFAGPTIDESYRTGDGNPVYAFIWPQYAEVVPGLALEYIPGNVWREQLEYLCDKVDGIIIWVIFNKSNTFANSASDTDPDNWWYQTLDFIRKKGL